MKKFLLLLPILAAVLIPTTAGATGNENANQHAKYDICDFQGFDEESGEPQFVVLSNETWATWLALPPGDNDEIFVPNTLTEGSGDANQFRCSIAFGVTGPQGEAGADGADSEVAGPAGKDGNDGAASTIPGPAGAQGSQGTAGADSSVPGPVGAPGAAAQAGVTAVQHNCTTPDGYGYTTSYPNCGVATPAPAPVQSGETLPRTGISGWFWMLGALMLLSGVCLRLWATTGRKA